MIGLRPAERKDYAFLLQLNEMTMKDHIVQTFGSWDDEIEEGYFREEFETLNYEVITCDDLDVGCLAVTKDGNGIFVNEIQIHPCYQCRGIGRAILESLIEESEKLALPVILEVLKVNKRAYNFYQKIGFQQTGENETHFVMGRNPGRSMRTNEEA